MHTIEISDKIIGNERTFIIAEAANNHMCNISMAKQLIDNAVDSGADAIKFQTYKAEKLVRSDAKLYWDGKYSSQLEYYSRLDKFGEKEYKEIFRYANDKGIIPFSTPFDTESAEMLNDLGVSLFKIASCDLPDTRLLRKVSSFNKPIILSTGASSFEEIDQALEDIYSEGNKNVILLACMLSYPTEYKDANIRRVIGLSVRYSDMIIGLSDHTPPDEHMIIPSLAVSLGAKVIEKHYTLDRNMNGSGHFFSVEPSDLEKMIKNIRLTESVLGDSAITPQDAEMNARENARRSIVANIKIKSGTIISSDMLGMKRPADGLPGYKIDSVIGKKAIIDIEVDQSIDFSMLEE